VQRPPHGFGLGLPAPVLLEALEEDGPDELGSLEPELGGELVELREVRRLESHLEPGTDRRPASAAHVATR
jgi:hypothetical protein